MAAKIKTKSCVHCGHIYEPNDRHRDLANPQWHPEKSHYCSDECHGQLHRDIGHRCSAHIKDKARREAAKAERARR